MTKFAYLIAAGLFILSLYWMNSPQTARRGVLAGTVGAGSQPALFSVAVGSQPPLPRPKAPRRAGAKPVTPALSPEYRGEGVAVSAPGIRW